MLSNRFTSADSFKILVVEDSELQRKLLVKRLYRACPEWEVTTACSGEQALEEIKSAGNNFDVVLVDENLSEYPNVLRGHQVVKIMRSTLNMKRCIIIGQILDIHMP